MAVEAIADIHVTGSLTLINQIQYILWVHSDFLAQAGGVGPMSVGICVALLKLISRLGLITGMIYYRLTAEQIARTLPEVYEGAAPITWWSQPALHESVSWWNCAIFSEAQTLKLISPGAPSHSSVPRNKPHICGRSPALNYTYR